MSCEGERKMNKGSKQELMKWKRGKIKEMYWGKQTILGKTDDKENGGWNVNN